MRLDWQSSDANYHHPPLLGLPRLFDQTVEIVGVAGEQHDWTGLRQGSRGHQGVNRASVTTEACRAQQFAGMTRQIRRDGNDAGGA